MGTNYYAVLDACLCCGRGSEELHIGKSSGGWCFALNTHPDNGIETLEDWRAVWAANPIKDEYGTIISPEHMDRIVAERKPWGDRALLRSTIDGRHCIAHGDGTYDIMRGEFS